MRNKKTNDIVMIAMFTSMVMAATYIGIPTPGSMGGYWHLGTLVMMTISLKYGWKYGMLAGGIGMTLFDIFSPWAVWAPATLVIRLTMGALIGFIAYDKTKGQGMNIYRNIIGLTLGSIIMLIGYFIFQAWLLSGDSAGYDKAIISIPGNLMQIVVGFISLYLIRFLPEKDSINIT